MSLLHNLKEWFSKLFKFKAEPVLVPSVSYTRGTTTVASTLDEDFYTEEYSIDGDRKKRLARLIQYPEFRDLEWYLKHRINASARRMKSLLKDREDNKAANEASAIDAFVSITQDMKNFWEEVKLMDEAGDVILKEGSRKKPKVFGEDSMSIKFNDETIVL